MPQFLRTTLIGDSRGKTLGFQHVIACFVLVAARSLTRYNVCVFAYGQTGSGKTWTMTGGEGESRGLTPRAIDEIFGIISSQRDRVEVRKGLESYILHHSSLRIFGEGQSLRLPSLMCSFVAYYQKYKVCFLFPPHNAASGSAQPSSMYQAC